MGCGCGKNKAESINNGVIKNMIEAGAKQPGKIKWFKDGINGLIKCLEGKSIYSDEDIQKNRDTCRLCEFSSRNTDGKINLSSQCMAPDPAKNNAPCGCFIVCKTSQDPKCPLGKWTTTPLTVKTT